MIKRMEGISKWIIKHISIIQIVLLFATLLVGVFFNISGFNANAIIIPLLGFISCEMIITCWGYLEKIESELSKRYLVGTIFSREPLPMDFVEKAKHSVFISGGSMGVLQDDRNRGFLKRLAERKVVLTLAYCDYKEKFVIDCLTKYFLKEDSSLFNKQSQLDEAIKKIKTSGGKIETICMNVFNPIAYIAVDYRKGKESEFSEIRAKHYLLNETRDETSAFWIIAVHGSPLFTVYQKQIEIIENQNGKLTTR